MNGIINIYKEPGFTSHDVVGKLRRILGQKRIGHTGTLDPAAEGVLPVCLGTATRICEFLTDQTKTYRAVLRLGVVTDTQDATGNILSRQKTEVSREQVQECLDSFQGVIRQVPPMYSARKVNGKRLYDLARKGMEVEREAREVTVWSIRALEWDLPCVTLSVTCSKGTYIRTLCHDIGQSLGCGGCMDALLRTRVGSFELENAVTLSQVEKAVEDGTLEKLVIPTDSVFIDLPELKIREDVWKRVQNGNPIPMSASSRRRDCEVEKTGSAGVQSGESPAWSGLENGPEQKEDRDRIMKYGCRVYGPDGTFAAVYIWDAKKRMLVPRKMFL